MFAKEGGFQPAKLAGIFKTVLTAGDTFQSGENHIDFPNKILTIPENCVGIVEKSKKNNSISCTVSILQKDTITARRLIKRSETC
jgi:hypothetical protein